MNAQDLGSVDEKSEQLREEMGYKMKIFPKITGDYPLHIAAQHGHTKIVSQLFYLGAKMENRNRYVQLLLGPLCLWFVSL